MVSLNHNAVRPDPPH